MNRESGQSHLSPAHSGAEIESTEVYAGFCRRPNTIGVLGFRACGEERYRRIKGDGGDERKIHTEYSFSFDHMCLPGLRLGRFELRIGQVN